MSENMKGQIKKSFINIKNNKCRKIENYIKNKQTFTKYNQAKFTDKLNYKRGCILNDSSLNIEFDGFSEDSLEEITFMIGASHLRRKINNIKNSENSEKEQDIQ